MCQKAAQTAASVMGAIEPTLKSLLTATGLINTPDGQAAIAAYDAALTALKGWQSGTPAQDVIQLIGDFEDLFNALPVPDNVKLFANIILAGISTVIGILTANSPAPIAPEDAENVAEPHEQTAMFQAHVAVKTAARVEELVPGFRRSYFHSPESQYKKAWNDAVKANPDAGVQTV